jgi:disulfide bond formation protein DsbB
MSIETLFTTFNTLVALGVFSSLFTSLFLYFYSADFPLRKALYIVNLCITSFCVVAIPLLYQYIFGLPPCMLCWMQRICVWPVALMSMLALYRKQISLLKPYLSMMLSIGIVIAIYHYSEQFNVAPITISCGAVGQSVSCGGIDVIVFNFLTIPLMSAFAQMSLLMLIHTDQK